MAELYDLVVKGPDLATDSVVRWRCVDLLAVVQAPVRGRRPRKHDRQVAAPTRPDPVAAAAGASEERPRSRDGI
jgi:hypothetical protein